jgi:hypothetical protein
VVTRAAEHERRADRVTLRSHSVHYLAVTPLLRMEAAGPYQSGTAFILSWQWPDKLLTVLGDVLAARINGGEIESQAEPKVGVASGR